MEEEYAEYDSSQNVDGNDQRPLENIQSQEGRHAHPEPTDLVELVRHGDLNAVRKLCQKGVDLNMRTSNGQTALHISYQNKDQGMMQLLLESGIDTEAADQDGNKALYLASESGMLDFVKLLLQFGANYDSYNDMTCHTAFFQAIETRRFVVAQKLLDVGTDIDAVDADGETPLFGAVRRGDEEAVSFLLRNGASKKIRDEEGRLYLAEDYASEGTHMMDLLQSDPMIQGPSVINPKSNPKPPFVVSPLPVDQTDKINACNGFECTIIDFFVEQTEQRIQKTVSIYELLYGKGPKAIMNAAKGTKLEEKKRSFRWYHLPANNIEWVEILASRHFEEQDSRGIMLDEDAKFKLSLTNPQGQQYRATTAQSSFMRPKCRTVEVQ
ncbi:hypothetical protein BTUL_0247g00180 [Botrytis tulipae]|uniref:Uncharacterized protein n=1 Tax=Botrytis tulipae TaxID=87230 RepID=A0A4Z1E974_9HELO|nr:hypothetical protein BTUL_0247g00180 [Botrytis tulipae]